MEHAMLDSIRDFLKEHSEYVADFKTKIVNGREDVLMSTDGMIAFTDWTIKNKRSGNIAKAKRFREMLRKKFGR
jgi:hypothetical protein